MTIQKTDIINGLIQYNFFPTQKKSKEEIPPVFSSKSISSAAAKKIRNEPRRNSKTYAGYDFIEYKATKFNNVPRYFGIPHPKSHIDLTFEIANSWKFLRNKTQSENSFIKPEKHFDGRLLIIDYEQSYIKTIRHLDSSFNNHFFVKTDVSSCFPSVYTHAIPWALVGFERSKRMKGPKWKHKWFNKLDESARWQRRNETQGVIIGPAASNILSEIILCEVDRKISQIFTYERYIDDYSCYAKTYEEAEEFIRTLSQELKKYNLHLNPAKTQIIQLPIALNDDWATQLAAALPKSENPSISELIGYLDHAMTIQKSHMEGSVIKYAAKSIIGKATGKKRKAVAKYLLGLSIHYPVLIPVYSELLLSIFNTYDEGYVNELLNLLDDRILNNCSDGICWLIYYLQRINHNFSDEIASNILGTRDCLSITLLALEDNHLPKVIEFANNLDRKDLYLLDRYWLLLYQLFKSGKIGDPYRQENVFNILKVENVNFVNGWT